MVPLPLGFAVLGFEKKLNGALMAADDERSDVDDEGEWQSQINWVNGQCNTTCV